MLMLAMKTVPVVPSATGQMSFITRTSLSLLVHLLLAVLERPQGLKKCRNSKYRYLFNLCNNPASQLWHMAFHIFVMMF